MSSYGDETCTIVKIIQPFCSLTFGGSPCSAQLGVTGDKKCFNTRKTCQDPDNIDLQNLSLYFSRPQEGLEYLGYVIPSIESVSITPMQINIGAMDKNVSPMGQREVLSVSFSDHKHSDLLVDKYRLERHDGTADQNGAYDPYERGTFWGKWLARNPYYEGYEVVVYDGTVGQSLEDMQKRHYFIDKINGPSNGRVTLSAKDLFTKIEDRKAKAPFATNGELDSGIDADDSSATLKPEGIGNLEYPASGRVCIGKEIISFTRSGDTLTLTQRGDLNTEPEAHDEGDKVQLVLSYDAELAHDVVHDLLTTYAGVDESQIDYDEWNAEALEYLTNLYTAHIVEPTSVSQLIGELSEQAGFTVWHDVTDNMVKFKALRPAVGTISHTVTDDEWIVKDSLSIKRMPEQRATQVWVYYGQVNPVEKLDDKSNYRNRILSVDPSGLYSTESIREVFSRWIPQFGRSAAVDVANRILQIFRDPPFRASFTIHSSRDGALILAFPFRLDTQDVQSETGTNRLTAQLPIKLFRQEEKIEVESQQLEYASIPGVSEGAPGGGTIRKVFIDADTTDFNLRTEHDALFTQAVSGDLIVCEISTGVVVGSTTSSAAFTVGEWPEGVDIEIYISGRIAGKGGKGGGAGAGNISVAFRDGYPGEDGGTAFLTTRAVSVYNGGVIAGGGGGGGGGGGNNRLGGGGGGGAGRIPGTGGTPNFGTVSGQDGDLLSGGVGGDPPGNGGNGGDGGDPGQAGQNGENDSPAVGGTGGAAGLAIDGIGNISWIDENGDPTMDQGTIVGPTS